jgi:hypothetical protein
MTTSTVVPDNDEWVALTNLSIGRPERPGERVIDRMADRVPAGERVRLTDDEAHGFLTRHRLPVIRKATDADTGRKITARDLFNRRRPAPLTDQLQAARGQAAVVDSTQLIEVDPALSPEGNAPDPADVDPDAPGGDGEKSAPRGRAAKAS